jgi:hypothetical protein
MSTEYDDSIMFKHAAPIAMTLEGKHADALLVVRHNRDSRGGGRSGYTPVDTAPALEDCEPIKVNEETRWKAKHMLDEEAAAKIAAVSYSHKVFEQCISLAWMLCNQMSDTLCAKVVLTCIVTAL